MWNALGQWISDEAWRLGSNTEPLPWSMPFPRPEINTEPLPWGRLRPNTNPVPRAVAFLIAAVNSKEAAKNMTNAANNAAAQQIITAAGEAIAEFIDGDDICPRWPYPGPPPWLSIIATELTLAANTLQEGGLRTGILQVAGQVLDRAYTQNTAQSTKKRE
jgi:hypothetical protein